MIVLHKYEVPRGRVFCTGLGFRGSYFDPDETYEAEDDPGDFFPAQGEEPGPDDYESYTRLRATGGCRMTRKDIRELCRGRNRALNASRMSLRTHRDGACADKTAWMKTERRRPSIKLKVNRTPSGAVGLIG